MSADTLRELRREVERLADKVSYLETDVEELEERVDSLIHYISDEVEEEPS